jgi:hypothetical protein
VAISAERILPGDIAACLLVSDEERIQVQKVSDGSNQ